MEKISREKKINIRLVCLLVMFLTSLPLLTDFLLSGTDLQLQLIRIESLAEGIRQYGPTLWAKPNWIEPRGLSFAFFYGDTFLYIPALLRVLGLDVQSAFRIFLILINVGTVLISYHVFSGIFEDAYTGLLGMAVYSAGIYKTFLMYSEVEVGECLAVMFMPLVLYGLWLLFWKEEGRNKAFLYLALGLTGVFQSHILSFCMAVGCAILILLLAFRSWKEIPVWKQLGLAVLAFLGLNLGYLYQTYRYLTCGAYVINPFSGTFIQAKGLQIAQMFMCFYQAGGSHEFGANGINDAVPVGLGITLLFGILLFLYLTFVYGEELSALLKRRGWVLFWFGTVTAVCSLLLFPWDRLLKVSGVFSSLVSLIQAPWHFLIVSQIAFVALLCLTYTMEKNRNQVTGKAVGIGFVCLALLTSSYLAGNLLFTYDFVRIKTAEEILYENLAEYGVQAEPAPAVFLLLWVVSVMVLPVLLFLPVYRRRKQS